MTTRALASNGRLPGLATEDVRVAIQWMPPVPVATSGTAVPSIQPAPSGLC
jgi:hypothetical protein